MNPMQSFEIVSRHASDSMFYDQFYEELLEIVPAMTDDDLRKVFQSHWKGDLNIKPTFLEMIIVHEKVFRNDGDMYTALKRKGGRKESQGGFIAHQLGEPNTGVHKRTNQILHVLVNANLVTRIHTHNMIKPLFWLSDLVKGKTGPVVVVEKPTITRTDSKSNGLMQFTCDCCERDELERLGYLSTEDNVDEHKSGAGVKLHEESKVCTATNDSLRLIGICKVLTQADQLIPWDDMVQWYSTDMKLGEVQDSRNSLLCIISAGKATPAQLVVFLILQIFMSEEKFEEIRDIDVFYFRGWFRTAIMNEDGLYHKLKDVLFWTVATWREYLCEQALYPTDDKMHDSVILFQLGMDYMRAMQDKEQNSWGESLMNR